MEIFLIRQPHLWQEVDRQADVYQVDRCFPLAADAYRLSGGCQFDQKG